MNNYQLTFEHRDSYLYVYLSGEDSFSSSLSYWNEIADRVKTSGFRKLLLHENLSGRINTEEMQELIMDLLPSGLREVQVAVFDEQPSDAAVNTLGQSLATDAGANIKLFDSLDTAVSWITQEA